MKKILALAAIILTAAACSNGPPSQTLVPVHFAERPATRINVAQINLIENYKSSAAPPFVEHQFPTSPAQGVKLWAGKRLQAVGSSGVMEIVIEDASVKETPLPKKDGIEGFFTDDQSERYDGSLRVSMRLYTGASALADAEGSVTLTRSRTINEKASVIDRERLFNNLTQDMMTQFDLAADARLRQYFAPFIR